MPKLTKVGVVPVAWSDNANRYMSKEDSDFATVFNRLKPVLDPIMVTVGPSGRAGGPYPWEGSDTKTGRRYVARKHPQEDVVSLEEVID